MWKTPEANQDLFLSNRPAPLVLDEIQYAPEVVPASNVEWTKSFSGQYILSGSQQWAVMKSLAESLAGRAVFLELNSFSMAEIGAAPVESGWLFQWLEKPGEFRPFGPGVDRRTFSL